MLKISGKNKLQTENKIFICGDSFSSIDKKWTGVHWSQKLEKLMPQFNFVNLAYAGATNLSISAQVEKALDDVNLAFIIINASDIFRIDLPNTKLKRKEKTGSIVVDNEKFNYNDFKKISEKIYTEVYKNSFATVENFYNLLDHNYDVDYVNKDAVLSSFGMWSLIKELSDNYNNIFSENIYKAAVEYFRYLFDLNIRFQNDLAIIEGKLYKLTYKKIPYMYNLGGLTNKKSFLNKVFPHVISQLESRYRDIKEYQSEINLFDISEESYLTDTKAPGFHIANEDDHVKIAKYYHQRINEILNNAGNK